MSWTNLRKKIVKARKEHHCNWCHSKIEIGETYTFSTNITEGNIHDWKECCRCKELVKEMFDMGYGDEYGYCDDDSFSEFMEIEYDTTFHDYINLRLPKFLQVEEQEEDEEMQQITLRPCILVNGKKAVFHRWIDKSRIVDPSAMIGGHEGGVIKITVGIVEYENGEVHECYPTEIRFTDRKGM